MIVQVVSVVETISIPCNTDEVEMDHVTFWFVAPLGVNIAVIIGCAAYLSLKVRLIPLTAT